jgi:cytochrome c oxidase cbb3-type subunit 4
MELDVNTLRTVMTVLAFIVFAGTWIWAWSGRRQKDFSEAAQAPFKWESEAASPACPLCASVPSSNGGSAVTSGAAR